MGIIWCQILVIHIYRNTHFILIISFFCFYHAMKSNTPMLVVRSIWKQQKYQNSNCAVSCDLVLCTQTCYFNIQHSEILKCPENNWRHAIFADKHVHLSMQVALSMVHWAIAPFLKPWRKIFIFSSYAYNLGFIWS